MPFPAEVSAQRKRCRKDDALFDSAVPPAPAVAPSARDPRAPNVSVSVRGTAEVEPTRTAGVVTHNREDCVSETLTNNLPGQYRSEAVGATASGTTALGRCGAKSEAVLAAAKEAAAVLKQHACREQQQRAMREAQHVEQAHRCLINGVGNSAFCHYSSNFCALMSCLLLCCCGITFVHTITLAILIELR